MGLVATRQAVPLQCENGVCTALLLAFCLQERRLPPLARRTFEACARSVDQSVGYPLRLCLEERHELLQIENTHEYRDSLGGS